MLLKDSPAPERMLVGDLSDSDRVLTRWRYGRSTPATGRASDGARYSLGIDDSLADLDAQPPRQWKHFVAIAAQALVPPLPQLLGRFPTPPFGTLVDHGRPRRIPRSRAARRCRFSCSSTTNGCTCPPARAFSDPASNTPNTHFRLGRHRGEIKGLPSRSVRRTLRRASCPPERVGGRPFRSRAERWKLHGERSRGVRHAGSCG